jgi:hypothetical protein
VQQCTLDYPVADYPVCGLSVHDYFFYLSSFLFIKLRTIKHTQNILFIKAVKSLCDSSLGARAHRDWEVCEKSTFLSLCVAKGAVGV